ncbi:MAG: TIGR03915 family putative DNA repair protein [Eggerthellaceae bacterium]|nr:TIGR03915 family putative DNA repair protein [Eggerthellaceae bacterium]
MSGNGSDGGSAPMRPASVRPASVRPASVEGPFTEIAYVYDGTLEGLLSAIFAAYARHEDPTDVSTAKNLQVRLGQYAAEIETNPEHALRVKRGLCRDCGRAAFDMVKHASLSDDPRAGTAAYRFVRYAMGSKTTKPAGKLALSDITHPDVEPVVRISRFVNGESHQMKQFLRFEQVEGDIWVARCAPKASVVPLIMDWFSTRFNTQPFVIYDEAHGVAGVYEGKDWHLVRTDTFDAPPVTVDDQTMRRAWKHFYDTIAVESRYNPELRRQHMPKRFWKHLPEMQEKL